MAAERAGNMGKASVTLTSYNMGNVAESDFNAWVSYVSEHIDERCGFPVSVDAYRFGESVDRDSVTAHSDDHETVRDALRELWDSWCAEGAPGDV